MTTRTVKIGTMTYREAGSEKNTAATALLGEEVDVHEDDLERFDRLNQYIPPTRATQREDLNTGIAPAITAAGIDNLEEIGETDPAPEDPVEVKLSEDKTLPEDAPSPKATTEKWREYAISQGIDKAAADQMTKADLIEVYSETK